MPKGSKSCSKCGKSCGPRTKICDCGQAFTFVEKKSYDFKEPDVLVNPLENISGLDCFTNTIIFTPGKNSYSKDKFCPFTLKSSKQEDVMEWLDSLRFHKFNSHSGTACYSRHAIIYFVRGFYEMYTEEYDKIVKIIEENMEEYKMEKL